MALVIFAMFMILMILMMMVTPIVMGIKGVYVGDVCDVYDVCNAHQPESANVSLAQLPLWRPYPQCVKCILNI